MTEPERLPHLIISGTATTEQFVSPHSGRDSFIFPQRDRITHGEKLIGELNIILTEAQNILTRQKVLGVPGGIIVEFESDPSFSLKFESLENERAGIRLLNVRESNGRMYATVFIPEGKLTYFISRFEDYLSKDTPSGKPLHQPLVDGIARICKGAFRALWTDSADVFPEEHEALWFEIWLRKEADSTVNIDKFREITLALGMEFKEGRIEFIDRVVILAYGTRSQIEQSVEILNMIAELRRAKVTADFFTDLSPFEQAEWIKDAIERITPPPPDAPAVCLLDTGVNNGHPLIAKALKEEDMHACEPSWNKADEQGHGTEMAGLAIYGDLTDILSSRQYYALTHKLESVKILHPQQEHPEELYGAVTSEAVSRAVIDQPERNRAVSMAISAKDTRDRGKPSSWSAAIDQLCTGITIGRPLLFLVAAGNTDEDARLQYPESNYSDSIHDPGQAWNALTVGAFTEKVTINEEDYQEWTPVATSGDLSPSSCTSLIWESQWPLKPDLVFEGGNVARSPGGSELSCLHSLQLLTTNWRIQSKPLTTTGDTSGATALAARMAATIMAYYPNFWPETIRAIMVHSAKWTEAMKLQSGTSTRDTAKQILRCFGYGVPDLLSALWSTRNALTLIIQEELQPYQKTKDGIKTKDFHIHRIPWPEEELNNLHDTEVSLKVTLSYFIEPSPAQAGWKRKHSYASHRLCFDVNTPLESLVDFRKRINKAAREDEHENRTQSDSEKWAVGPQLRKHGSVHSDIWKGTAAELASMNYIAIYPESGWWRDRPSLKRWNRKARYALIVSIETPEVEVDIYTPVLNKIAVTIPVSSS